jgi:hypothetical protein
VSAADEAWALECRLFDVQVRLFTANADDDDIEASLRRVIGIGALLSRGRTQLGVIEVKTVATVGLLLAHNAAVDYAHSVNCPPGARRYIENEILLFTVST